MTDEQFLRLIDRFLAGEVSAGSFWERFTAGWTERVEALWAEVNSLAEFTRSHRAFLAGRLDDVEYTKLLVATVGGQRAYDFQAMIDAVHSAAACYRPEPQMEGEIDDKQLLSEVRDLVSEYKSSHPSQA
ncbi:MAG TPA: hypothetical protein VGS41_15445 [Chthonomonadales bacterium]|nr:hypothetical protein [Chthonomonadales bacterium]